MASSSSARARRNGIIEGINVTPLVDISLVLLVVFMVTAKLVVAPALQLDLPVASRAAGVSSQVQLCLGADGRLLLDGKLTEFERLGDRLREVLAQQSAKPSEVRALIQAERAVSHGRVVLALDALQAAGVSRIAFATQPASPHTSVDRHAP